MELRQELFGEALIINVRLVGAILKCRTTTLHAKHPKLLRFSGKNMKYGTWQLCLIKFRQHQFPSSAADVTTFPKAPPFRKSVINVHQLYVHSAAAVDSKISRNLLNFHARTSEKRRRRRSHPSRSLHYPGSFELTRPYHSILTHGAVVVVLLSHRENGKLFKAPAFCALRKICNAVFCSLQDFITVVSLPLRSTLHARQIKNASCKVQ